MADSHYCKSSARMLKDSCAMSNRVFLTALTPRACHARLNAHLATPFLTWLSASGVDGRTDTHGFTIWLVSLLGERRVVRLRARYEPSPSGTSIVSEFLPPERWLPSLFDRRMRARDQEATLVAFLRRTLEATEVGGEASTRARPPAG